MKYLGLLCVKKENVKYRYTTQLAEMLKKVCSCVFISVFESNWRQGLNEMLQHEDMRDYDGIIIVQDEVLGIFEEIDELLYRMRDTYDVWGLDYSIADFKSGNIPMLDETFLVIEKSIVHSVSFMESVKNVCWLEYVLYNQGITRGAVLTKESEAYNKKRIDVCRYLPYTILVEHHIPCLYWKSFSADNLLKYSLQHELRRVMDYLSDEGYDLAPIWEYVIAELDITDLKKVMHLEYPLSGTTGDGRRLEPKKVAIFVHAFYEELYDRCIAYLKKVPKEIDIYISTKESGVEILKQKLQEKNVVVAKIVTAGSRGRDAGALLVGFRPYIKKYEYICFVHDKKTTGGLFPASEGMAFMDLVWDNLIPSAEYIYNIIELFEQNKFLGMVTPPVPVMGGYMASLIGKEWTICFEETIKLSEKLNAPIKAAKEKQPFALSSCFWCRLHALEELFDYPWALEDFPQEPLKLDGEINHAIERIFPYLVQRKGYYSGIVYQIEYASLYLSNLMHIIDQVYGELNKAELFAVTFPVDLKRTLDQITSLHAFCREHEEIYVYGAGIRAKKVKRILDYINVHPRAFLVTDKEGNDNFFEGYPVMAYGDVCIQLSDCKAGVIIGVGKQYEKEVMANLKNIDIFRSDL